MVAVAEVLPCHKVSFTCAGELASPQILLIGDAFIVAHGMLLPAMLPSTTLPMCALLQTDNWEKSVPL